MAARTQKAVFVYEVGQPVRLGERPTPTPKAGEVLIKVTAAQLLPHDAYGRDAGLFIGEKLPWILGSSLAGTITALGPDNTRNLKPGDRVFGTSNFATPLPDQSGLQEYAILQTDSLAHSPPAFSDAELSTLPVNLATAVIALFITTFGFGFRAPWSSSKPLSDQEDLDSPIVLLGGGTNIAHIFLRLIRHPKIGGYTGPIIAVAGLANTETLKAAGATHVLDRHRPNAELVEAIHSLASGPDNVVRVFDCASWNHSLALSILAADKPSRLLTLHPIDSAAVTEARPRCEASLVLMSNANLEEHAEGFWEAVPGWLGEGVVGPTEFRILEGLERVEEINGQLDEYAAGRGRVQMVVLP